MLTVFAVFNATTATIVRCITPHTFRSTTLVFVTSQLHCYFPVLASSLVERTSLHVHRIYRWRFVVGFWICIDWLLGHISFWVVMCQHACNSFVVARLRVHSWCFPDGVQSACGLRCLFIMCTSGVLCISKSRAASADFWLQRNIHGMMSSHMSNAMFAPCQDICIFAARLQLCWPTMFGAVVLVITFWAVC